MYVLGAAPNHAPDVFRFLNLATNKVIVSRNVIWLNKCYGDWKKLKPSEIEYIADEDDDQEQRREEEADGGMDEEKLKKMKFRVKMKMLLMRKKKKNQNKKMNPKYQWCNHLHQCNLK
jgi:hypothetical protein